MSVGIVGIKGRVESFRGMGVVGVVVGRLTGRVIHKLRLKMKVVRDLLGKTEE